MAGLQRQGPHYWKNSSPEMTFVTHCQQPLTSAPSISRSQFTAYKDFLSLTLFTLSEEEKGKGGKKGSKMLLYSSLLKSPSKEHHSSWVFQTLWEDINPIIALQAYTGFGNEDSFGFHLAAQSIFLLSAKLRVLDESKMLVSTLQHWEQRWEYVNCWSDLSQQTRVHKQDTPPTLIARHLHLGNSRFF